MISMNRMQLIYDCAALVCDGVQRIVDCNCEMRVIVMQNLLGAAFKLLNTALA